MRRNPAPSAGTLRDYFWFFKKGEKEKAPGDPLRTQELATVASFRTWRDLQE